MCRAGFLGLLLAFLTGCPLDRAYSWREVLPKTRWVDEDSSAHRSMVLLPDHTYTLVEDVGRSPVRGKAIGKEVCGSGRTWGICCRWCSWTMVGFFGCMDTRTSRTSGAIWSRRGGVGWIGGILRRSGLRRGRGFL